MTEENPFGNRRKGYDSTVNVYDSVAGHAVDVPGDPHDRNIDMTIEQAKGRVLGDAPGFTEDEMPVLVESDMSTDPVEGTQGSFSKVVNLKNHTGPHDCEPGHMKRWRRNAKPCQYGVLSVVTMAGVHRLSCLRCGETLSG